MFIHQSMNSFLIYQCTDYKLNVVTFISEVLYVYYVIDNKEVVSMEIVHFKKYFKHKSYNMEVKLPPPFSITLLIYRYFIYLSIQDYYDFLFTLLYLSKISTLLLLKRKKLQVNYPFPLTDLHQKQ